MKPTTKDIERAAKLWREHLQYWSANLTAEELMGRVLTDHYAALAERGAQVVERRTLRQWYAGQALKGLLADGAQRLIAQAVEESAEGKAVADTQALTMIVNGQLAEGCLALADAMIAAERVKPSS